MLLSHTPCFPLSCPDLCSRLCAVEQPQQATSMPVGQHPCKGSEEAVSFPREPTEPWRQSAPWCYPCPEAVTRSAVVDEPVLRRGVLVVWVQIPLGQNRGLDPGSSYPERALPLLVFYSSPSPPAASGS